MKREHPRRRSRQTLSSVLGILSFVCLAAAAFASPSPEKAIRARGSVELADPKGDVGPVETGTAGNMVSEPGFDMVHLSIVSDGKRIVFAATLTEPPGARAGRAVDFHVDTDANPKTGAELGVLGIHGVEYSLELDSCVQYGQHLGFSCAVSRKAQATANWGAMAVERYKGTSSFDKDTVVDDGEFVRGKASARIPVKGAVLQGSVDYADLGVKSGQTIRIVAA